MRNRHLRIVVLTALLIALPAGLANATGKPDQGCAPGFDLGELSLEEGLELPRILAGIGDGVFTVEGLTAAFASFDKNGNGRACFKDVGALNNSADGWGYLYNVVDDVSAAA